MRKPPPIPSDALNIDLSWNEELGVKTNPPPDRDAGASTLPPPTMPEGRGRISDVELLAAPTPLTPTYGLRDLDAVSVPPPPLADLASHARGGHEHDPYAPPPPLPSAADPRVVVGAPAGVSPYGSTAVRFATDDVPAPSSPLHPATRDMLDRFELGDFSGALIVAESILQTSPDDVDARRCAERCRETLHSMYLARLGGLAAVPTVAVPREQVRWLSLDHRSGFLLSLVDGRSSFEEILDVSGMAPLDALRILFELSQQNVIAVG